MRPRAEREEFIDDVDGLVNEEIILRFCILKHVEEEVSRKGKITSINKWNTTRLRVFKRTRAEGGRISIPVAEVGRSLFDGR